MSGGKKPARPRASSVKRRIKDPDQLTRIMTWVREAQSIEISTDDKLALLGELHDLHRDLLETKHGFEHFQAMKRVSVLMCMGMDRAPACRIVTADPDIPMRAEALEQRFKDRGGAELTAARAALKNGGRDALFVRVAAASLLYQWGSREQFFDVMGMTPEQFETQSGVPQSSWYSIMGLRPYG